ncbi:MAG: hypothetical protein HFH80_05915 [Lachnospiraceae bacterium]|nr:hypothetical protein [Lachnospiraceae bacterium]
MKRLYLGIDVGTTHLKVCAVDAQGNCLSVAERDQELIPDRFFGDSVPAELLYERCTDCIREVLGTVDRTQVAAMGITSMAEAGIPIDAAGNALMPLVPWNTDPWNADPWNTDSWNADPWSRVPGEHEGLGSQKPDFPESLTHWALYQKTGLCWHPKYTINRLWQMRRQRTDLFERMACFLSVSDYVLFRLTGQKMTEESLACRTMLYNIHEQRWDRELTAFADMADKLPSVATAAEDWPLLSRQLADAWGLGRNVRVCVGGHDHLCAARALGIAGNDVLNSMGTSEVYVGFFERMPDLRSLYDRGILTGRFDGRYYWICNMPSSGASIEWLRSLLLQNGQKMGYRELMQASYTKCAPLFYLPFVNGAGTHRRKKLPGGFLGADMGTGASELIGAVYEGIACESAVILENLAEAGIGTKTIHAVGGGTMNRKLMQAKADFTAHTYETDIQVQASAVGAALAAAGLTGHARPEHRIRPDSQGSEYCRKKYQAYTRLTKMLGE